MKWINPIWRDPVGWSEKVARTKLRVFFFALAHVAFVLAGLTFIYTFIRGLQGQPDDRGAAVAAVVVGGGPIVFIGIIYPITYLYAMHRLLKMLKEKDAQTESTTCGSVKVAELGDGS